MAIFEPTACNSPDAPGDRLAILEPRCVGIEHVSFNAALIVATIAASPSSYVDVYGDRSHIRALEDLLRRTRRPALERVRWRPLEVPERKAHGWRRLWCVLRMFHELDRAFDSHHPGALVVATTDPYVLAAVKVRLVGRWNGIRTAAVLHELLAVIAHRRVRSTTWWSLVAALAVPSPPALAYVVLSESIRRQLMRLKPRMAKHVQTVELPSLLGDLPVAGVAPSGRELRFGFAGVGRDAKGLEDFIEVARTVRAEHPNAAFEIVGTVPKGFPREALAGLDWSERELSFSEFVSRLRSLSYVIWLGRPSHYSLVASGSLVDAIAVGVPVICLAGPFVDHLFTRLGNIGIRCATVADVVRAVQEVAARPDARGYVRNRDAARAAAHLLAPELSAPLLAPILLGERRGES